MIDYPTIKAYLKLPDDSDQALLQALETRVQSHLEGRLDLYLGPPEDVTWRLDGTGTDRLWLPQPVAVEDPQTVPTFETADGVGGWDAVVGADVELGDIDPTRGRQQPVYALSHGDLVTWPSGRRNVRVTTRRGYEAGAEPGELVQLALGVIGVIYGQAGHEGMRSESIGDYSYTRATGGDDFDDAILGVPGAASTISRWRRWKV